METNLYLEIKGVILNLDSCVAIISCVISCISMIKISSINKNTSNTNKIIINENLLKSRKSPLFYDSLDETKFSKSKKEIIKKLKELYKNNGDNFYIMIDEYNEIRKERDNYISQLLKNLKNKDKKLLIYYTIVYEKEIHDFELKCESECKKYK